MERLKQEIAELVNRFINSSRSIYELSLKDEKLDKFSSIKTHISEEIERLSMHLRRFQNLTWDTLDVAFFGETNAGKSTLIEALIKGDGRSIGTGIKDFTKELRTFSFGDKTVLLDMPGIEGDEKKVKDEIWKAVNKANIIFYILPHDKEPERNTLLKIRNYLNKNAFVYGSINIRGNRPPEALKNLLENNLKIVEERTRLHLNEYLGDSFKDVLIIHTLYAFFARAKYIPDNLKSSFESALKYYGSKEQLERISNIRELEDILKKENQRKDLVISWDYTRKILKSQEDVISHVLFFKKDLDKALKSVNEELLSLQESLKKENALLKENIKKITDNNITEFENDILEFLYEAIENKYDKEIVKKGIENRKNDFSKNLEEEIKKEINNYSEKAKGRINLVTEKIKYLSKILNKFSREKEKEFSITTPEVFFKAENIFKELEWKFEEILREIGSSILKAAGIVLAYLASSILGIILGIISLLSKLWDWFFDKPAKKKAKAKQEARVEVKKIAHELRKEISSEIKMAIKQIEDKFNEVVRDFKEIKSKNKEVSNFLQKIIDELKEINHKTSEAFLKYLNKDIKFGYIQVSLKEGTHVLILGKINDEFVTKLEFLGIDKKNIYTFDSIQGLQDHLDITRQDSEFFKRTYDIFMRSLQN